MKIKDFSLFSSKMAPNRWKKSKFQKFLIFDNYILYELVAYQKLLESVHWRKIFFQKTFFDFQFFLIFGTIFWTKSWISMTKIWAKSKIFEIPPTLTSCNFLLSGRMKISGCAFWSYVSVLSFLLLFIDPEWEKHTFRGRSKFEISKNWHSHPHQ